MVPRSIEKERQGINKDQNLRTEIIKLWHAGSQIGHSGIETILKRFLTLFYRKRVRTEVKQFIQRCDVYEKTKSDLTVYPGLL